MIIVVPLGLSLLLASGPPEGGPGRHTDRGAETTRIELPAPARAGTVSVEQALAVRRSVRHFGPEGLSLVQVSQLLWAAYGVSKPWPESASLAGGLRTAPSAGACYPLELYLVVGNVAGLPAGVYRYRSDSHALRPVRTGDVRAALCAAAWGQEFVSAAPVSIVYFAVYRRTTDRYGRRGRERYVCMDLGHSAENVYLQCAALGLGTCAVGAFNDAAVSRVICANQAEEPLYIMPVGRPQASTQTATQQRR